LIANKPKYKRVRTIYKGHNGSPNTLAKGFYRVDETVPLSTMKHDCPNFFRTKFGRRETYDVYRGFLICRCTVQFTGCRPIRKTTVYLYDPVRKDTMHCGGDDIHNIGHARKLIDRILKCRRMWFDMSWSEANDPIPEVQ